MSGKLSPPPAATSARAVPASGWPASVPPRVSAPCQPPSVGAPSKRTRRIGDRLIEQRAFGDGDRRVDVRRVDRARDLGREFGDAGGAFGEYAKIGDTPVQRRVDDAPGERRAAGERDLGAFDGKVGDRDRAVRAVADGGRDARLGAEQPGEDRLSGIEAGRARLDLEVEAVGAGKTALGS